jgi:N-carbamoylputrescine amidase
VAQTEPTVGDLAGNRRSVLNAVEHAVDSGIELLVLPELADTGYFGHRLDAERGGAPLPDAPIVRAVSAALMGSELVVVMGMCELAGNGIYDTAIAVDSTGLLGAYRKTHLWGNERNVFDAGESAPPLVKTRVGTLGLLVCFDIWFPETVRLLAMQGAEIICVPSNWDLAPGRYFDDDLRVHVSAAQAHINEVILVCADRAGADRGISFAGRSVICEPRGVIAGPGRPDGADWLEADVDMGRLRRLRSTQANNHLTARRTDLYQLSPTNDGVVPPLRTPSERAQRDDD